ncbi:MAG: glycosyltransferase [Pseudomonadales bacterium]|nr:glycosyltransferase [Pseudomonadales bacterium]
MTTSSVLLSGYHGDSATGLDACLDSILAQTQPADEIVLIKDGPLSDELDDIIERYAARHTAFRIVALPENRGLIHALNTGLEHCTGELILRMDADDIARPERFARQIAFMDSHAEITVAGTAMEEFIDEQHRRIKPVREYHEDILRQMPWRNPVNHPTACFRRQAVVDVGGYPDLRYLEDYFLWAKLAVAGCRFQNLPEALHQYRFDDNTLYRRSGWLNFRNECYLRFWMYRHGLTGLPVLITAVALQVVLRFAPTALQRWLWRAGRNRGTTDR